MRNMTCMVLTALLIIACGKDDPRAELNQLEAERDAILDKIKQLKLKIENETDRDRSAIKSYVQLQTIEPTLFKHFIKIQGNVISDQNILIPAQASGVVKRIHVTEGAKVIKDQLLAELDGAIYESTIAEIKTNLELAKTIFERQERLWQKRIGSEVQYLQAKTNKETLEKRLATVEEQYRLTKIVSPIDGTVDQILIKEGEGAAAGFGTIRVVNLSELKIEAFLSENYITQVQVGDSVLVEIPVLDKTFASKLSAVSQVIDPKNRTFPIEVGGPFSIKTLRPNMLVVLTINDYRHQMALTVPVNVVQTGAENKFVFTALAQDNSGDSLWTVYKKIVTPGLVDHNTVEIISGLQKGDRVVISGFQNLLDGQVVRISESAAATNQ